MARNLANLAEGPQAQNPAVSSLWIRANAGSGKTYVLTRQVVKLLLLGVPPERICCITYTKAAASEMRSRIIARLRELLLADDAACRAEVESILEAPATDAIMSRARLLFGTVLDSMSGGLQLTTIHGFCQQLLRAFPLEAGIAPHFTVADDAQASLLAHLTKHRLLTSQQAADAALGEAITLIADCAGENQFDAIIKLAMHDRDLWRSAWAGQPEDVYRTRLYAALGAEEGIDDAALYDRYIALPAEQEKTLRAAIPGFLNDSRKTQQALGAALEAWFILSEAVRRQQPYHWLALWLIEGGRGTPRAYLLKDKDYPPGSTLRQTLDVIIEKSLAYNRVSSGAALAEESFAVAVIAQAALDLYDQIKAERGVLDYDDLISRTRELLTTRELVGWVMAKLDHRLDHLLVDEAQDTSSEQWRIAHALVDDLVVTSGSIGSANVPRSLFVVGDEKQSIFSFQGAAPDLYAKNHHAFDELLQHSAAPLASQELLKSYRSAQAILSVVDQVASDPAIAAALSASGQAPEHVRTCDEAGEVVIHPLIPAQEKTKLPPFTIPLKYEITRTTAQQLSVTVAAQIDAWIKAGTWRAGDILILIQKRTFILPLLRALQRAGIPVAGIDRLVLGGHLAVKDLLALMQWTRATYDDLALAQVLRSPLIGIEENELLRLSQDRQGEPLWQRVQTLAPGHANTLLRWLGLAFANPYDFLTQVLEVDGARPSFATRFGEEIHEILDELKEQAMHMPEGTAPNLANFAAWVATNDRQIKRELEQGDHNHVRVMTAHGSKGLEAPCVLLVDTTRVPDLRMETLFEVQDANGQHFPLLALSDDAKSDATYQTSRAERLDAMLDEYYRLLYVAMTRAKFALHVFGMEPSKGQVPETSWYSVIARAMKSMPGMIEQGGCVIYRDAHATPRVSAAQHAASKIEIPAWARATPTAPTIVPTLSPSRLMAAPLAPFAKQRGGQARERGVRLHRMLQFMDKTMTREQLTALIAHLAPDWNAAEQTRAETEIWTLMESERWLWEWPAQAEVNISGSITVAGRTYPVIGQIDRLVHTDDTVVVLDYKTGRDIPEPSAVSPAYLLQLKLYVALLETLYPGKTIRPAIVWTAGPQLMWLDEAVNSLLWDAATLPDAA